MGANPPQVRILSSPPYSFGSGPTAHSLLLKNGTLNTIQTLSPYCQLFRTSQTSCAVDNVTTPFSFVFAVPSSKLINKSKGTNWLILQGANLTITVDDILEAFNI